MIWYMHRLYQVQKKYYIKFYFIIMMDTPTNTFDEEWP